MASSNELTVNPPKPELPETPQGQQFTTKQLGAEGTPHGIKETAGLQALDQIRFQIARQMNNETLLCPIDNFLEHYGPTTVKAADVKKCKKFLITSNLFDEETGRWTDFAANPSQYEDKEDRVFQDLKPIVDKIFEFAKGRRNNYKFQVVEHKYLEADIPGTNHKMDGCLVDGEFKTGKIPVRFIKSPHEYKKQRNVEDQRMVRAQVVGDCQHILCEDPRRMFIFAVTIEDTRMGVWYFSRSHSIKALSFDWVEKDVDTFIHVFLAFAYASPEELGIDPTVHLAPIDPQAKPGTEAAAQHYIYQCPVEVGAEEPQDAKDTVRRSARLTGPTFKYFKTVRSINDMRPYNISGRNTRIWQVVEVKGPDTNETVTGEQLILKDVWLDIHRSTEAENMDAIFKAIDELIENSQSAWGDNWKERLVEEDQRFASFDDPTKARLQHSLTDGNYKSLFLTKLHAWDGATSKKLCHGALNSAAGVDIFPEESASEKAGRDCRTAQGSLIGSLVGSSYAGNSVDPNNTLNVQDRKADAVRKARRQFAPKRQSRFIYKEVCFDLDKVGTLGNFMDLISQVLDALRILFCAGWVHRDISSSNLLAFRDNGKWKIKLADLEFAEKLGYDSKGTDPRTGTPFFMPFEIMKRFHLLNDKRGQANPELSMAKQLGLPKGSPEYDLYKAFSQFGTRNSVPSTATTNIPGKKPVIRYNFQHDLESIWWTIFYFITALVNHSDSQDYAKLIFQRSLRAPTDRQDVFEKNFINYAGDHLHDTLEEPFSVLMEQLRSYIHEEYLAREIFGQLTVHESYSAIHGYFATRLREFLETNEGNWKQMPIAPNGDFTRTLFAGSKRGFEHDGPAAATRSLDKRARLTGK